MHGDRQEEDGIAVVGPRASAEVLLHGLHNGKQLLGEDPYIMEHHLHGNKLISRRSFKSVTFWMTEIQ